MILSKADYTQVGANAVVNKSFTKPGTVIAGVPAKVVNANPNYPGLKAVPDRDAARSQAAA